MLICEIRVQKWQDKYLVIRYKLSKDEFAELCTVELLDVFDNKPAAESKAKLYKFVFKRNQEELKRIRKVVNKYVEHIIPRSDQLVRKPTKKTQA